MSWLDGERVLVRRRRETGRTLRHIRKIFAIIMYERLFTKRPLPRDLPPRDAILVEADMETNRGGAVRVVLSDFCLAYMHMAPISETCTLPSITVGAPASQLFCSALPERLPPPLSPVSGPKPRGITCSSLQPHSDQHYASCVNVLFFNTCYANLHNCHHLHLPHLQVSPSRPSPHKLTMPDSQNPRRARVVVPLQLQIVHHVYLRDPQPSCECTELDARQSAELLVERDLGEPAADVAVACGDRRILLRHKHLFLERGVVAVPPDAE